MAVIWKNKDMKTGLLSLLAAMCVGTAVGAPFPWRSSHPLNTTAATDGEYKDYYPTITNDGQGNWVCTWCASFTSSSLRDFEIYVARSSDNGLTWTDPQLLDPFANDPLEVEDDFDPFVITDGLGHWLTAWYSSDNHAGTVGDDTDLFFSLSNDLGATWTTSAPLNTDAATDHDPNGVMREGEPVLAIDPNGLWVAVWRRYQDPGGDFDIYTAYSSDLGVTWSAPALLTDAMLTDISSDSGVDLVFAGDGHWIASWITNGELGEDNDLYYSTSTDGIHWTAPAVLNSDALTDGDLDHKWPDIACANGRCVAVWSQGTYNVIDDDLAFVYSDDYGATWSDPAYLNTNAETDLGDDWKPSIATDSHGRWVVTWYSDDNLGLIPLGADDDILFSVSEDNGLTWSDPDVVNDFGFQLYDWQQDWNPKLSVSPTGQWITVWHSEYDVDGAGNEWDIMFTTACLPTTLGDVHCDGIADLNDVSAMQLNFVADVSDPEYSSYDIDRSGLLDFADVLLQIENLTGPADL